MNRFKGIKFSFKYQRKLFKRLFFLKWFYLKILVTCFYFIPIERYVLIDIYCRISVERFRLVKNTTKGIRIINLESCEFYERILL
jgi:hypothetical protein